MPLEILAQPLLVRHLDFTHESHFQPVAARLEQLAVLPGQMLGEHVKAIFVKVPVSLDTEEDEGPEFTTLRPLSLNANYNLIRLASQVAHLRSFSMKNACRPSFFALLCIIPSSNSIQHLTLTLDTSRMPGESLDSVPHNLNRLQNLRSLKLVCYENWPTPSTSGLSLPKLQDFIWESDCENEGASVLYLDRCDMRNLGSLRIMVWCDQSVLPEGLLSIRRFVANLLQLRRLASCPGTFILDLRLIVVNVGLCPAASRSPSRVVLWLGRRSSNTYERAISRRERGTGYQRTPADEEQWWRTQA
jgi:hypothetical protein